MQSPNFFLEALVQHPIPFLMVGFMAVGKALWPLFRPAIKGRIGEGIVNLGALRGLDRSAYRSFKDLYIPRHDRDELTQIDHVVVSQFGVFVIETKNYAGWIFGRENDRSWTQCLKGGMKYQFQNPLWQNQLHVNSLAKELDLPDSVFHSVVYFCGDSTFKTHLPGNVMNSGLKIYILKHGNVLLPDEEVVRVNAHLAHLVFGTDKKKAKREHAAGIRRRSAGV